MTPTTEDRNRQVFDQFCAELWQRIQERIRLGRPGAFHANFTLDGEPGQRPPLLLALPFTINGEKLRARLNDT